MLTLDRRLCRPFLSLARRAFGLSSKRTGELHVTLQAVRSGVSLRVAHYGALLTYGEAETPEADASAADVPAGTTALAVPLSLLAEVAGGKADAVTFEAEADGVVARWTDRGVPQTRRLPAAETLPPPPPVPELADPGPGFAAALAACAAVTDETSTRYALACVRLRAAQGDLCGTDSRQLLVCDGFRFPFAGELLLPKPALLASKELPGTLSLGWAEGVVTLRRGPWTLRLPPGEGRFPQVEAVVPQAAAALATVELDPGDLAFLAERIGGLPGAGDARPVTLDLAAGRTLVRGRDESGCVELRLARSPATGEAVRLATNRDYLARAAGLGLTRLHLFGPDRPVLGVAAGRRFVWMPLDGDAAAAPTAGVVRLSSADAAIPQGTANGRPPKVHHAAIEHPHQEPDPMPDPLTTNRGALRLDRNDVEDKDDADESLDALIRRAEATGSLLSDAARDVRRLTAALRRRRKADRLMQVTLAGLDRLRGRDAA